jgi:hypothetical protein
VWSVEKLAAEESSGHRFLAWVVRHASWTYGKGLQPVAKTGGYCWSFYFHAPRLLLLRWILEIFEPSMATKVRHYVRHLGDEPTVSLTTATPTAPTALRLLTLRSTPLTPMDLRPGD